MMRLGVEILLHVYASAETWHGLSILIDCPSGVFDLKLEQHKFVEESWEENRNPVSVRASMYPIKHRYEVYRTAKLFMFSPFNVDSTSHLLTCL